MSRWSRFPPLGPGLALILFAGLACGDGSQTSGRVVDPQQSALVETAEIQLGPVKERLRTLGWVDFDPTQTRSVTLDRAGIVLAVRVVRGQAVHAGEALLRLGPAAPLSPEVQQAKIARDFAERELKRVRRLYDKHLATNQDLVQAEKDAAMSRAALAGLGQGRGEGPTTVVAPADGVVVQVHVGEGDVVHGGQEAVVLASAGSLIVRTGVEQEDLPRLHPGLSVLIKRFGPGGEGDQATGRVAHVGRLSDPTTQTLEGIIEVDNPPTWLVPGEEVKLEITLRGAGSVTRVPREALVDHGGEQGVFVIEKGRARWTPVQIGIAGEQYVQAKAGVGPGDVVATKGRTELTDGMAVRVAVPQAPK